MGEIIPRRGSVVSVNVSAPRIVEWRGRAITTSIYKTPVEGKILVSGVNFAGDDQADREVHGGPTRTAYAYAAEDYEWWNGELGRELPPGQFGDNLTLRGVDVNAALIGERWRVGSALFQVTTPRVPCYKLGIKMDDPTFPKRFAGALRPGAYLALVESGEVGAGDPVSVVDLPEHALTIKEMLRIYLFERARVHEFLKIPEMPEDWRAWAQQQTNAVERGTSLFEER